jgi:hypothetical protein
MDPHDGSPASALRLSPGSAGGRRLWHAVALLLAAIVAWLVFAAYRQPDLILDLAGMRIC